MSVGLVIDVRVKEVISFLQRIHPQFPFAASVALNRTAEDGLAALRTDIPKRFTIREAKVMKWIAPMQLPRPNRATKQNLAATLKTDGYGRIFAPFEEGIPKTPSGRLGGPLAPFVIVPTSNLRPTKQTVIPRSLYPTNLGLSPRRDASGKTYYALGKGSIEKGLTPFKGSAVMGKRGTFALIPGRHNIRPDQAGVYQRTGGTVRMLWALEPRVRRPKILHYQDTIASVVARRFAPNWDGAWALAMRTAR